MILDIDKSVVISDKSIDSPILGIIPPQMLSGVVKALMLMAQKLQKMKIQAMIFSIKLQKSII